METTRRLIERPPTMTKTPHILPKNLIGSRVRQARQRASMGLSQVALSSCLMAAGLSVCRTAVSKIESGERYVTDFELVTLAKCLHVTTAFLLGETTSYKKPSQARRKAG